MLLSRKNGDDQQKCGLTLGDRGKGCVMVPRIDMVFVDIEAIMMIMIQIFRE